VYKNMELGVVSLAFLCHVSGGEAHTSSESVSVDWLTPNEAIASMPEARTVQVTDALRDDGPFVRVHDGSIILSP
jgi:hypothetical protein